MASPSKRNRETKLQEPAMNSLAPSTLLQSVTQCGQPLPAALRFKLEAIFKADFSTVRVRIDAEAVAFGASAFAQGYDISFAPGRYAPATREGAALLAHELAHVVQQGQGRVPVPVAEDSPVVEDAGLEAEADAAAAYCAARLFPVPGHGSEATMPAALLGGSGVEHGYERRPIQCQRTSAQSYGDFRTACWTYLSAYNATAFGALNHRRCMKDLYSNVYSAYNHYNAAPKVALAHPPLYQQMINLIDATNTANGHDNDIKIQTGSPWPVLHGDAAKAAITAEYQNVIGGTILPAALTANAAAATNHYLHIYPNPVRAVVSNWRIGINVPPGEIAAAVAALIPVMQANPDINHIKFAAPTIVGKPDSVIVYMRNNPVTYAGIEAAVRAAVDLAPAFHVVHQFAPMWNELAPGVAVAAEPPRHGGSFGNYRCIIAYAAYLLSREMYPGAALNQANFNIEIDDMFNQFGMPTPANPHRQNALAQPFDPDYEGVFMALYGVYKQGDANAFTGVALLNR